MLSNDAPQDLVRFVKSYEAGGAILCLTSPEELACCFRSWYHVPCPMDIENMGNMFRGSKDIQVYYMPEMEKELNIRGCWFKHLENHIVLIDPDRPQASRIKTYIHEVTEQLLDISYNFHPMLPRRSEKERERYANSVAACVKMPPDTFRKQVRRVGLDIESLAEENKETLAGVTRHLRDLIMEGRHFYYCRFDIVRSPRKNCPELADLAEQLGGKCILVQDVVRTSAINIKRTKTAFPSHNLPAFDHYRILNPALNAFITRSPDKAPVFFAGMEGCSSDLFQQPDLFGDTQICVLLKPYGKIETKGFWMLAIHPKDRSFLDAALEKMQPEFRGELDWLFSWDYHTKKRPVNKNPQMPLPNISDQSLSSIFGDAIYPWSAPPQSGL